MISVPSASSHSSPSSLAPTAERPSISQEKHEPLGPRPEQLISPAEAAASASDASSSNHTGSDESSTASQQTDATNMHSDAHIEAGPVGAPTATASEDISKPQSRRSSEGNPLVSAAEGAGQVEEYPTPSGALLPPPEGERSVLAGLSGSTLKVRRGVPEGGVDSSAPHAAETSHSVPAESEETKVSRVALQSTGPCLLEYAMERLAVATCGRQDRWYRSHCIQRSESMK